MRTRVSALFLASLLQPLVGSATVGAADLRPAKIDVAVHLLFDRSAPSLTQKDAEEVRDFAVSIDENAVHGSDGPETAEQEIAYFFKADEICARTR